MSTIKYQLTVEEGPSEGRQYPLNAPSLTIGRDPMSDIVLSDPEVSRYHARLTQTAVGGYRIEDMKSTNSTHVDGVRLEAEPVTLKIEQMVLFGSTVKLRYDTIADNDESAITMMHMEMESDNMDDMDDMDDMLNDDAESAIEMEIEDDIFAPSLLQTNGKLIPPPPSIPDFEYQEEHVVEELPYVPPADDFSPPPSKQNKNRNIILGITAVLFLLCCCCLIFPTIMYFWLGDIMLDMAGLL